jgi:lipocalin
VQKVRKIAESKGFDLAVLNDVDQSNCLPLPSESALPSVEVSFASRSCPPAGFDSIQKFDLAAYVSKPWYIQQQAVTTYLPKDQNYCVSADYTLLEKKTFFGYDIKVRNIAYEKNGKVHDSGDLIYAKIVDGKTGKLEVAPSFLPAFLSGEYWVIDYDESDGYALVSGGPPKLAGENGLCRTGSGVNGAGLWIFTRQQARNEILVQKVRKIAESKGFDLAVLNDVDQSSCPPLPMSAALV